MNKAAVMHIAGYNYAFPVTDKTLRIRLKAAHLDLKKGIIIYGSRYPANGADPAQLKELVLVGNDLLYDYFETDITLPDSRFRYYFYLDDGERHYWFTESGFVKSRPTGYRAGYFQYPFINKGDIFNTPDWVKDAVVYQIFPERFYNENPDIDLDSIQQWGEKPEADSFFGGDLEGIIKKLDYIKDLGVNTIYLTPIFTSPSNHKYNIDNYFTIDSNFGSLDTAKRLVSKSHRREIKVVFDAVFNHCGFNFFAFRDLRQHGDKSKYRDWFFIDDLPVKTTIPVNYCTFANDIYQMPKLNTSNKEVQDYLLKVAKFWIEEVDIDGWRLDVADEIDPCFWRRFRQEVKTIKPDLYIVGENWHNSQKWLQGDQFDGIMNYRLSKTIYEFFADNCIGPSEFNSRLITLRMMYKDNANYSMLNLLDSHDTPRLLYRFSGKKEKMMLALLFQFTYIGAPMILYGDEVGITGGDDPDCRRCMVWNKSQQDRQLYKYYKKLITIRNNLVALRRGGFKPFLIDELNNTFGFIRNYQKEKTIVVLNNSPYRQKIKVNGNTLTKKKIVYDYLNEIKVVLKNNKYRINISPFSGSILSNKIEYS
ncbi:MAG: glycoside hydrolase family 13 protein [Halanaerobiales bacterium]